MPRCRSPRCSATQRTCGRRRRARPSSAWSSRATCRARTRSPRSCSRSTPTGARSRMSEMYRRFLNARSPLRLLEKGLHGGLGRGNLGLVLAGPGIGKTSFLVGVALDDLLRGKPVLHVALDHNVQHVRDYYDTVFAALAASAHLDENHSAVRAEMDKLRRIRVYPHGAFD